MTIKAIETSYAGQLFRSKLEARWAFFFDRCGVKWKYEYEGFALPSGNYLPDFYLPGVNRFLEIKPEFMKPEDRQRAIRLLSELQTATEAECWMAQGEPIDNFVSGFGDVIELSKWGMKKFWGGKEVIVIENAEGQNCIAIEMPYIGFVDGDIVYVTDLSLSIIINNPYAPDPILVPFDDALNLDTDYLASAVASKTPNRVRDRGATFDNVFDLVCGQFKRTPEFKMLTERLVIFHGCNFMSTQTGKIIKPAADAAAAAFRFNHKARA